MENFDDKPAYGVLERNAKCYHRIRHPAFHNGRPDIEYTYKGHLLRGIAEEIAQDCLDYLYPLSFLDDCWQDHPELFVKIRD